MYYSYSVYDHSSAAGSPSKLLNLISKDAASSQGVAQNNNNLDDDVLLLSNGGGNGGLNGSVHSPSPKK